MMQRADISIKRATSDSDDKIFLELAELESATIPDGWSAASFKSETEKENGIVLYAEYNGKICGLLTAYTAADEADITNVSVADDLRKQGIATLLLKEFECILSQETTEIFLEVRCSNIAAVNLYKKTGFEQIAVRKRFYSNPVEDAIIMKKAGVL